MAEEKRSSFEDEKPGKDEFREVTSDTEYASPPTADELEFLGKEKKLTRKLDTFIAPVMFLLMLISYLDRGHASTPPRSRIYTDKMSSNIGFAATQGMTEDIGLGGSDLNIAVSIFYITYILAEFPASLYVKRLQFNRVIPAITFLWGICCLCMGFINNAAQLYALRLLLGLFEGCLFPAMTLFLANWYKREELGFRVSFLFIGSALSGAVGGLIALGILYMDGVNNYAGWRWLYIIEGLITVAWAAACIFLVPKDYSSAYFLNAEDKAIMRIRAEMMEKYSGGSGHYTKTDIKLAAKDITTWVHAPTQVAFVTILYGFGTFLPIILKYGFDFSTLQAQYLVVPVCIWGAIVYFIGAILADKYNARFWSVIICAPIGVIGYAILLNAQGVSAGVQYFATFLISTACYLCTGTNISWLGMNRAPDGKRAASMGILLTFTNLGGIISGQIYQSNDAPAYTLGHAWSLGSLAFGWCGFWVTRALYKRREKQKAEMRAQGWTLPAQEVWTDRAADWKYQF